MFQLAITITLIFLRKHIIAYSRKLITPTHHFSTYCMILITLSYFSECCSQSLCGVAKLLFIFVCSFAQQSRLNIDFDFPSSSIFLQGCAYPIDNIYFVPLVLLERAMCCSSTSLRCVSLPFHLTHY